MEDSTAEATRVGVEKKIDSFAEGGLGHATGILSGLWEIANKDGDIKAPSNPSLAASPPPQRHTGMLTSHAKATQVANPAHWLYVKTALIKSIRKGVFFDRKYWARYSKTGDVLKPVYFSSIIMGDKVQQLNNRTSEFGYRLAEALRVPSGKTPQGSERPHKRPRGRRQRRQRL